MTVTYYTLKSNGIKQMVTSEVLPATSNKKVQQWIESTVSVWENDGWYVKYEDGNMLTFHRGFDETSYCIIVD